MILNDDIPIPPVDLPSAELCDWDVARLGALGLWWDMLPQEGRDEIHAVLAKWARVAIKNHKPGTSPGD